MWWTGTIYSCRVGLVGWLVSELRHTHTPCFLYCFCVSSTPFALLLMHEREWGNSKCCMAGGNWVHKNACCSKIVTSVLISKSMVCDGGGLWCDIPTPCCGKHPMPTPPLHNIENWFHGPSSPFACFHPFIISYYLEVGLRFPFISESFPLFWIWRWAEVWNLHLGPAVLVNVENFLHWEHHFVPFDGSPTDSLGFTSFTPFLSFSYSNHSECVYICSTWFITYKWKKQYHLLRFSMCVEYNVSMTSFKTLESDSWHW